ncbi:MAG: crossover junction endodeoxyribonuclease RuvC [Parcubacteria group bacterium Gr01-1014_29]|nr:MAG: crossover junction endodeoxyribonuclease RuvC [Parcubacteria group bacterium Gr01-1014_29]
MIILGIDPGYGRVGYGLVRKEGSSLFYVTAGCIETKKTDLPAKRLHVIYTKLRNIIAQESPNILVLEQLFFAKNTKTALRVAETRGVLFLLSEECGIPLQEFTPLQVKLVVCGYGKADKIQVQRMVMRTLHLTSPPSPDDAADALAIALTAAFTKQWR